MHFLAVDIDLREEPQIRGDVLLGQVAPLSQKVGYITVVEVVTAQYIIGKSAINCESIFPVPIGKQAQLFKLLLCSLLLLLFTCQVDKEEDLYFITCQKNRAVLFRHPDRLWLPSTLSRAVSL